MGQNAVDQEALYKLMDYARGLRATDVATALNIFTVLKDQKSPVQDVCRQQYAIALQETGQISAAIAELQRLVQEFTDATSFRAYNLLHLAEASIAIGQLEEVASWLEEADRISSRQRDFVLQGMTKKQRAVVAAKQGDYAKALERIEDGTRIVADWSQPSKRDQGSPASPALTGINI